MDNETILACEEVKDIRKIRHEISAEFGHDVSLLAAYCQTLESNLRQSGEYTFAETQTRKDTSKLTSPAVRAETEK